MINAQSSNYRNIALILLMLVYVFNFVDRTIIGILSPYIKDDLDLTYEQLGLLKGFAFALFYTVVGIPIAWLADRYNRVRIVAISLTLWSFFTALSGVATNFFQMAIMRVGVGVGEAGGSPPSHSIISDLFPASERARALAIYSMGIPVGVMFAYFVAGAMVETYGWRNTFIVLGVSGIVLAVIVALLLKEPVRGQSEAVDNVDANTSEVAKGYQTVSLATAFKHMLSIPSWWAMCMGITWVSFMAYAVSTWHMDYLKPSYPDIDFAVLTTILGLLNGLVYALGTYLGGHITDKLAKRDIRTYGYVPATAVLLAFPAVIGAFWIESITIHFVLSGVYLFLIGMYLGPSFSIAQSLAPVQMRAISTALFFLILNLIALGGGPTTVGFLAGWFEAEHGQIHAVRLALTIVSVSMLISVVSFWMVSRYLPKDWNAVQNS